MLTVSASQIVNNKCRKIAYNVNAFKKVGDENVRKLLEFISTGRSETSLTNKITKGAYQKAVETAKVLKSAGISINLIIDSTGLSVDEIEKL